MRTPDNAALLHAPVAMSAAAFSEAGHKLIDKIAGFLEGLPHKPVTTGEQPSQIRAILGNKPLPIDGAPAGAIIDEAAELLFNHSLFNGHPRFWGYITSSATPIGALADLLAGAVNPNVGAYILSPMATEIERQTVQWMAELIGFPAGSSGVFVSGGNMANFVGFLAARKAKATWDIRKNGLNNANESSKRLVVYCATCTHTWIQKAADLFGLGTDAIRWIDVNEEQQIDVQKLEKEIVADLAKDALPFLVVGNAGAVGTGAVDPLFEMAAVCKKYGLWFHVDGAYGAPAALLPECANLFKGLDEADSVAIDPHKWLYAPLEAGCILIKQAQHLTDAFSFHPEYYNFDGRAEDPVTNYYDYSLQNSRGFRALKVWLCIQQAGRKGYEGLIRHNIELAQGLFEQISVQEELQAVSCNLSITTFRYKPKGVTDETYLNTLNEVLLNSLQAGGKVFLSNAVVAKKYCLRVCIVNFRTSYNDLKTLVEIVLEEGRTLHAQMKNITITN